LQAAASIILEEVFKINKQQPAHKPRDSTELPRIVPST